MQEASKISRSCPQVEDRLRDGSIRAITFDAGDTLIFDRPSMNERVSAALTCNDIAFDHEQLAAAVNGMVSLALDLYLAGVPLDDPSLISKLTTRLLELLSAPTDLVIVQKVTEAYAQITYERFVPTEAIALLETLRSRGFKIGIISDWEPDLIDLLKTLSIDHLFDSISVSAIVGACKPSATLFNDSIEKLGQGAAHFVHVGDYFELDVAGAKSIGMRAILYDWKRRYDDTPRGCPVARSFSELSELLLSLPVP